MLWSIHSKNIYWTPKIHQIHWRAMKGSLMTFSLFVEVKCSAYFLVEINHHICERFCFEFLKVLCERPIPKITSQNAYLSGPWFPICKMREFTMYVPIIGFITSETTSSHRLRIPMAKSHWSFLLALCRLSKYLWNWLLLQVPSSSNILCSVVLK